MPGVIQNEIAPFIEALGSEIADFTVGFARIEGMGTTIDAAPAGSGSLVTVGSSHGILTAAHVLEHLPDHGEVGLVRFPQRQSVAQKFIINMEYAEKLVLSADSYSENGPDLGFLRLAPHEIGKLQAYNVFFNLAKRRDLILSKDQPKRPCFDGLSGLIGEWTSDLPMEQPDVRVKGFRALYGVGLVVRTNEIDGFDLLDFEVTPDTAPPKSFGGMSGGGLWRVYCSIDKDGKVSVIEKTLFGVAFYQTDLPDQRIIITCHGPESVYGRLIEAIWKKWPEQSVPPPNPQS